MHFIGIDISKFKHDCVIVDSSGEIFTPSWSFANDHEGFSSLLVLLESIPGEKRIGFESTGHYGMNLKLFLEKNGYSFMEFNPVLLSRFNGCQTLRRTKTDAIDAQSIARYLMTAEYKPHPASFYHIDSLKSLTRFRDSLVRQRSQQLVSLTNISDKLFPEFKPFFKNRFSATALYILAHYPSSEHIANMNAKSYDILRRKSHGKFRMGDYVHLKELARNTVGTTSDFLLLELQAVLDIYSQLDSKIDEIQSEITKSIIALDPPLLSIVGIGPLSAAVIYSEFGDFSRFLNPAQMLSFAGLEPGYFQSGTSEYCGRMVKHGSSFLRYAIMNCCMPLINHNLVFAEYYAKKRAEGKPYRVAISHVAKKLIRIIFALQSKNVKFDPLKLI